MDNQNKYDSEVDLSIFFTIIAKRKKVVLSVFFIFAITATMIVFLNPKLYIVSEVLKPPTVKNNENLISLQEMEEKIRGSAYDYKVSEEAGLAKPKNFNFDARIIQDGNFIKVNLITKEENLDLNSKILNTLFTVLKKESEPILNIKMDEVENKIAILKIEASKIEIEKEKINTPSCSSRDRKVIENQEDKNITIKQLELALQDILIQIDNLKKEKESISNVIQLQPPMSAPLYTTIDKIRRAVAFSMLGPAFGILLAFFLEFWQKFMGKD